MYVEQSHHLVRCYNIGEPAGSAKRTVQGPTRKTMPESKVPPRRQKESILHRYYARPFKEIYCYGNPGGSSAMQVLVSPDRLDCVR